MSLTQHTREVARLRAASAQARSRVSPGQTLLTLASRGGARSNLDVPLHNSPAVFTTRNSTDAETKRRDPAGPLYSAIPLFNLYRIQIELSWVERVIALDHRKSRIHFSKAEAYPMHDWGTPYPECPPGLST